MMSAEIFFFNCDSLIEGKQSNIPFDILLFHSVNFSSKDYSFDVDEMMVRWSLKTQIQVVQFVEQIGEELNF